MAEADFSFLNRVPEAVCKNYVQSSHLEWLETNHTGAFAMGTVSGVNTRRYHGLLIATLNPPSDRYSVFPRVEEKVEFDGKQFCLATVQYPGVVAPAGYQFLVKFSPLPHPTWCFEYQSFRLTKMVRLLDNEQSVVISYVASSACRMQVRLFVSGRDYHSLMKQNSALDSYVEQQPGTLRMHPYSNLPALIFYHQAQSFQGDGLWFNNHEYLRELERGLDYQEDLYSPGVLNFDLAANTTAQLTATLESQAPVLTAQTQIEADPLKSALNHFRVIRSDGRPTLIAGYPWFTDWSRDTLISLPALMACGFEAGETKEILQLLLEERKQGILPNRFTDQHGAPEYNTADASLWFFVAADTYIQQTNDLSFLKTTLFPAAMDMISWHTRGTFYGIGVDPVDHLLRAGDETTQLTWMDAKVSNYVVTPRYGKPVEINALWFNALQISSGWAKQVGNEELCNHLAQEATEVQDSFRQQFWNSSRQCLYDVLTPSGPDAALRPNQLFSISLPYPLLNQEQARKVIDVVKAQLLTPYGLRTLESANPHYRPNYDGDALSRDSAYHQGTVWPWLIGPYVEAVLYAYGDSPEAVAECRQITSSMGRLMSEGCLGFVGEVYDGDAPHRAGGCPAQLWSVAQLALAIKRLQQYHAP